MSYTTCRWCTYWPSKISVLQSWPWPSYQKELWSAFRLLLSTTFFSRWLIQSSKALELPYIGVSDTQKERETVQERAHNGTLSNFIFLSRMSGLLNMRLISWPLLRVWHLHLFLLWQILSWKAASNSLCHLRVISEENYFTHKLEYLILKLAVFETFSNRLFGVDLTIVSDNNPLTYVMTWVKLDAAGNLWLSL